MIVVREMIPVGFVRIIEGGVPVCDVRAEQLDRLIIDGSLVWDEDHYELTDRGRAFVRARLLN